MDARRVTIDLITDSPDGSTVYLTLVEQGPWPARGVAKRLRALQERAFAAIDTAVDGHLAARYPDSVGKQVVVRVRAFNLPEREVRELSSRISNYIASSDPYRSDIARSAFVASVSFEVCFEPIGSVPRARTEN